MDNKKVKRIIAREGLIIIFIAFLFIITLFIPNRIYKCIKKVEPLPSYFNKDDTRTWEVTDNKTNIKYEITLNKKENLTQYEEEQINKLIQDNSLNVVRKDVPIEINNTLVILFLLCVYPFYWLIRFIIWAVRILRE